MCSCCSTGVRAGVAAGVQVVGVASGQSEETLMAAGASVVVKDFQDLIDKAGLDSGSNR